MPFDISGVEVKFHRKIGMDYIFESLLSKSMIKREFDYKMVT